MKYSKTQVCVVLATYWDERTEFSRSWYVGTCLGFEEAKELVEENIKQACPHEDMILSVFEDFDDVPLIKRVTQKPNLITHMTEGYTWEIFPTDIKGFRK